MKMPYIRTILWVLFSSALFLSGCGGGTVKNESATLTSIAVTPATPSIVIDATLQFRATGTYSDNSTDDVTSIATWTSTNPSKATVTAGVATGTGVGTSAIEASLGGKTNSTQLTVTAAPVAPTIASQPANQSVTVGQTATFNVTASGTSPFTYQWRKGTTNVVGANSASYQTPATLLADNGAKYSVVVSNSSNVNVTSNEATLTVTAAPVAPTITSQPADQSVTVGQQATFNVTASGTSPFTYQWRKGTTNVVGANSASYQTPAALVADNGAKYSVVVSNSSNVNVTSNEATLTVTAPSSSSYVADYRVATDAALRAIPDNHITTARTTLHVAYFHTSHGTHVSYGAFGLPGFKNEDGNDDATKFGITNNTVADANKLDFHDFLYNGDPYADLSLADTHWDEWINQVRTYLDANAAINVMMWSWCDISGHSVDDYLSSMQTLINEYGPGGSKIGTGQIHTTPVTFIFMTGHANTNNNTGAGNPRDQAALITDYCNTHGYFCIDYYSIDTHAMDGTYYEDTGDNGNSTSYGGNFYQDWQDDHTIGVHWYENRYTPGGGVTYGEHNTQHITANRKAFAFWWVLARIAGY